MDREVPHQGRYDHDQNHTAIQPVPKFPNDRSFETELHRRVNTYFDSAGIRPNATTGVYIKSLSILALFFCTYSYLVFAATTPLEGVLSAIALGLAIVGIGANLQHDGSHNSFSRHRAINKLMAMTLELIGASSYFWQWKHNRIHHSYTNIADFDTDIDFGVLGRVAPSAKRRWFHRWQQFYIWPFYCLLAIKWQLFDDFHSLITGKLGNHRILRPKGYDLALFIAGKIFFFTFAFAIPLLHHPLHHVLFFYLLPMSVAGLALSMIFVLPHCVVESEFPLPDPATGVMNYPRAIHQIRVTVDFSKKNRVMAALIGGLNLHREHHLFPGICHAHYRRISEIVDAACDDFTIPRVNHNSYLAGLASHFRWLTAMGRAAENQQTP
jgi:linoleoyl-CoA desaturase